MAERRCQTTLPVRWWTAKNRRAAARNRGGRTRSRAGTRRRGRLGPAQPERPDLEVGGGVRALRAGRTSAREAEDDAPRPRRSGAFAFCVVANSSVDEPRLYSIVDSSWSQTPTRKPRDRGGDRDPRDREDRLPFTACAPPRARRRAGRRPRPRAVAAQFAGAQRSRRMRTGADPTRRPSRHE